MPTLLVGIVQRMLPARAYSTDEVQLFFLTAHISSPLRSSLQLDVLDIRYKICLLRQAVC